MDAVVEWLTVAEPASRLDKPKPALCSQGQRRKAGVTNRIQTAQIGRKPARKCIRKTAEEAAFELPQTGVQAAAHLVASGAFGAWAHGQDTQDSAAYAREVRRQAEARERG